MKKSLIQRCRDQGLSVQEVSDISNVSRSTLREWNDNEKRHDVLELVIYAVSNKKGKKWRQTYDAPINNSNVFLRTIYETVHVAWFSFGIFWIAGKEYDKNLIEAWQPLEMPKI